MENLEILTYPNQVLRQKSAKIKFDQDLKNLISKMRLANQKVNGLGIAAVQINQPIRLVVIENPTAKQDEKLPLTILINPKITKVSKKIEILSEGCLCFPKLELPIARSEKIHVIYQDLKGNRQKLRGKGLLARALQHEIDHLDGKLIIDRVKEISPEIRAVFVGTGPFAQKVFQKLASWELRPVATVSDTQIDLEKTIRKSHANLLIVSDYGKIIPEKILRLPKYGAIGLHPSLLPKYRGSTPIQQAILDGIDKTGVSCYKMTGKIDAGDILSQAKLEILPCDNAIELENRLAEIGVVALYQTIYFYVLGMLKPKKQREKDATYTKKLTREAGEIDWNSTPGVELRKILAFQPWPGTYTIIDNKRLIIHQAHIENNKLVLDKVQLEGKKPMPMSDFLRGFHGEKPEWFEKIKIS